MFCVSAMKFNHVALFCSMNINRSAPRLFYDINTNCFAPTFSFKSICVYNYTMCIHCLVLRQYKFL